MSTTNFKKLFELRINHSFFTNNSCNYFVYHLGENSQMLKERYGFEFLVSESGFSLFSNKDISVETLLNQVKNTVSDPFFDFNISVTDSHFFNYTNFPIDWNGTLHYSSLFNQTSISSKSFLLKPEFSETTNSAYFINLKIDFDTLIKLSKESSDAPTFTIEFASRETIWEYYIIDRTSITGEGTTVLSDSNIPFIKQENIKLLNGETALKFSSNQSIALSEAANLKFDLVNISKVANGSLAQSKKDIIFSGLPNPSLSQIDIIDVNGIKTVSSPMYIYV